MWIIVMLLSAVWTLILTAPIHCRGWIATFADEGELDPNAVKVYQNNKIIKRINLGTKIVQNPSNEEHREQT